MKTITISVIRKKIIFFFLLLGLSAHAQIEITNYKWNVKKYTRTIDGKPEQIYNYDKNGNCLTYLKIEDIGYDSDTGWVSVNDSDYIINKYNDKNLLVSYERFYRKAVETGISKYDFTIKKVFWIIKNINNRVDTTYLNIFSCCDSLDSIDNETNFDISDDKKHLYKKIFFICKSLKTSKVYKVFKSEDIYYFNDTIGMYEFKIKCDSNLFKSSRCENIESYIINRNDSIIEITIRNEKPLNHNIINTWVWENHYNKNGLIDYLYFKFLDTEKKYISINKIMNLSRNDWSLYKDNYEYY